LELAAGDDDLEQVMLTGQKPVSQSGNPPAAPVALHSLPNTAVVPVVTAAPLALANAAVFCAVGNVWHLCLPVVPAPLHTPVYEHQIIQPESQGNDATVVGENAHDEGDLVDVLGNVWHLSQDAIGSREVQRSLEAATNDDSVVAIASEFRGHVWEAMRDPYANYVLQKLIATMRPQDSQFIIDELVNMGPACVVEAARHRYGCRSVQRLLEHCQPAQLEKVCEVLLASALALSKHIFGNYVMQHILEYGSEEHRAFLLRLFTENFHLCRNAYASAVVSKALVHGTSDDARSLARALIKQSDILTMAKSRYGHVALRTALQLLPSAEVGEAYERLSEAAPLLRASRYGRAIVAAACQQLAPKEQ
jgi:hypothetical protein